MSFELLSEPIRRYIRDKGWERLRPIQNAAISKILNSDDNYILASKTASGKTEAAFLPILTKLNFNDSGVQVLYISPLIALINDQFYRIEELCKNLDVTVTKWHGEANKTLKNRLIKHPTGIVLITPESLEAMFVNKPSDVIELFSNLKYVVIDEIHSFLGTDRGTQLKSILSRLQRVNHKSFSTIGLSATIGDYFEAKKFIGNETNTKVLLDKTAKEINSVFRFFNIQNEELSSELLNDLYIETKDNKVLIFPNSRGRAEEVAVNLKKISARTKGHYNYFAHHSSVNKIERELIEYFAKNNKQNHFCISCTSTLELGIDIGSVDSVVQIDATNSISSLVQRIGRCGRKDGVVGNLFLYATNKWDLLQSVACWLLYKDGFIEPPEKNEKPYDILVHQALSITKSNSGIILPELIKQLKENSAFNLIEKSEIVEIINYLISIDLLEKIHNEVIIGVDGERVVNNMAFYTVFKTEINFKVLNGLRTIGEIPYSSQIKEDQNILLSARIWKIKSVDEEAKKIYVIHANDGKKPVFFTRGATINHKIREKIFEVLYSKCEYPFLDEPSTCEIEKMRKEFALFRISNLQFERPLLIEDKHLKIFMFAGTRINRTIHLLLNTIDIRNEFNDHDSSFRLETTMKELNFKWENMLSQITNIDTHISSLIQNTPHLLSFSKWGKYLPEKYKIELLKNKYYEIQSTKELLTNLKLIVNN